MAGSTYLEKRKRELSFFLSSYEDAKARRKPTEGDFLPVVQGGRGCSRGMARGIGWEGEARGVESKGVIWVAERTKYQHKY